MVDAENGIGMILVDGPDRINIQIYVDVNCELRILFF